MSTDENICVSIVIVNYNYAAFVGEAIESALNQTYPHVQVVVVDDGSSDGSRKIIEEYGDPVNAIFKENGGQASAWNVSLSTIRGDLTIFLDSDDVLLPETAGRVAAAYRNNPRLAKIQYPMEVIDSTGERLGQMMPDEHITLRSGDLRSELLTSPVDIERMAASGNAFPTSLLRKIMPVPERADRHGADWFLTLVPLLFGPVESLDQVGALYRVHGSNLYHYSDLDLGRIRLSIDLMRFVHESIHRFASREGITTFPSNPNDVLSVAFLGHRLISLKLDPGRHEVPGDTVWRLFKAGCMAARMKLNARLTSKVIVVAWFTAMAIFPTIIARRLATVFLFPSSVSSMSRLVYFLRRPPIRASEF